MIVEWRAVFSYPPSILGLTPDSFGPSRLSAEETKKDSCWRPEESLGWRSGTQRREVTEWRPV